MGRMLKRSWFLVALILVLSLTKNDRLSADLWNDWGFAVNVNRKDIEQFAGCRDGAGAAPCTSDVSMLRHHPRLNEVEDLNLLSLAGSSSFAFQADIGHSSVAPSAIESVSHQRIVRIDNRNRQNGNGLPPVDDEAEQRETADPDTTEAVSDPVEGKERPAYVSVSNTQNSNAVLLDNISLSAIPEPGTLAMLAFILVAVVSDRNFPKPRRRRRRRSRRRAMTLGETYPARRGSAHYRY